MTSAEQLHSTSFEEFVADQVAGADKAELVGGRVWAMSGGTERHDLLAGLIYEALAPGARAEGCRPFFGNRMLQTAKAAYYPDVMVVCGPADDRHWEKTARVIVEVLSPSTEDTDRREKTSAYAATPEVELYLLVDPLRQRIEVGRVVDGALDWSVVGPGHVVFTPYGPLDVSTLHEKVDATATT